MTKNKKMIRALSVIITVAVIMIFLPVLPAIEIGARAADELYRMPFDDGARKSQDFKGYLGTYGGVTYNGYHDGEDWVSLPGEKVYAVAAGTVSRVRNSTYTDNSGSTKSSGYLIIIDHSDFWAAYMHVYPTAGLKVGDSVTCGQQIAVLARTSNISNYTGAVHLHWSIRDKSLSTWAPNANNNNTWWAGAPSSGYYASTANIDAQGFVNPSEFIEKKRAGITKPRDKQGDSPATVGGNVIDGEKYMMQNAVSGSYAGAYTGSFTGTPANLQRAVIWALTTPSELRDTGSQWQLQKDGDAWIIHSGTHGIILNAYSYTPVNETRVNIYDNVNSDTQRWYLEKINDTQWLIRLKYNKNLVLSTTGTANGTNLIVQTYDANNNYQKWVLHGKFEEITNTKSLISQAIEKAKEALFKAAGAAAKESAAGKIGGMVAAAADAVNSAVAEAEAAIAAAEAAGSVADTIADSLIAKLTEKTVSLDIAVAETEKEDQLPAPLSLDTAGVWARDDIRAAVSQNLVPATLRDKYTVNITRAEFCALAVALYEVIMGREITGREKFIDTTDVNVEKAAFINVVNGVGGGRFDPNAGLTREQAAAMLSRLAVAVGKPLARKAASFADNAQIEEWAFNAVGQVQEANIMRGVGDNRFAPKDPYTREQSIVTILRLFDVVK